MHVDLGRTARAQEHTHGGVPRRAARLAYRRETPGYAPDLNPVEAVWGNVTGQELANLCAGDLGESAGALRRGMARVRRRRDLGFAFLHHAGTFL